MYEHKQTPVFISFELLFLSLKQNDEKNRRTYLLDLYIIIYRTVIERIDHFDNLFIFHDITKDYLIILLN